MHIENTVLSGLIFKFRVMGISVTLEIIDITCSDYLLRIITPKIYSGFYVLGLHIPGWGYPTVCGGYIYDGTLFMPQFYERMKASVEDCFEKHRIFSAELPEVIQLSQTGEDEEGIREYFYNRYDDNKCKGHCHLPSHCFQ
jgi:hypothetical protein